MSAINSFPENVLMDIALATTDITTAGATSTWFPMTNSQKVAFLTQINAIDAAGVFSALKVQQATDASGTGAKDITGAALTSFTNFAAAGAKAILQVDPTKMDLAGGFNHVAVFVDMSTDTGTNTVTMVCLREPRYHSTELNTATPSTNVVSV